MELPHIPRSLPLRACLLVSGGIGAFLSGCGGSEGAGDPSPDASSGDVAADGAQAAGEAAAGDDAPAESPDADECAGVRCASPPPCGQACTTPCCCNPACPPDGGAGGGVEGGKDGGADGGTRHPDAGPGDGAVCAGPGDCRLFSTCDCTCLALAAGAADPVCPGPPSECFRDPCGGESAACSGGHCVAQMR